MPTKKQAKINKIIEIISEKIAAAGGRAYLVGGCVRDGLMGRTPKDFDMEVYGVAPADLRQILTTVGEIDDVGTRFGVMHLKHTAIDVALPRTEKKTGPGHRDFAVTIDPNLPVREAVRRRDFTINAILCDPITGALTDPVGGTADLKAHVLRHVDDTRFPEDGLRVFRAAGFAARFGFAIAPETRALLREMDVSAISQARILTERDKVVNDGGDPADFFAVLNQLGFNINF